MHPFPTCNSTMAARTTKVQAARNSIVNVLFLSDSPLDVCQPFSNKFRYFDMKSGWRLSHETDTCTYIWTSSAHDGWEVEASPSAPIVSFVSWNFCHLLAAAALLIFFLNLFPPLLGALIGISSPMLLGNRKILSTLGEDANVNNVTDAVMASSLRIGSDR